MKKTLLKINNMKRFTRWLDQNNVHLEIVRTFFDTPWLMWPNERKSIERRLESTEQRDKFCKNRAKLRPSWRNCDVGRYGQYQKANKLLLYVKLRYDRKRKKL
tara:strand:+ start:317 stop:625 length:309 start_codon:yes stop_codon:yes gene_type:complete